MLWSKKGDVIGDVDDLGKAIKTLTGLNAYWHYPNVPKVSDKQFCVIATLAHVSHGEWGGVEIAVTNTYSCDIYTRDSDALEQLVSMVSGALLGNNVRTVGRTDGRDSISQRWSAHLTLQASYDVYGRMYRGL